MTQTASLVYNQMAARMLQLAIEYDPQPPLDSGSLEKADAESRERATRYFAPATSA